MEAVSGALIGGRYQLVELIGQGGMGRVWRGRDKALERDVAVKEVLLPQGLSSGERDHFLQRVAREARAAARLNHPGIITVHDVVEHEGAPVIVMELVTGTSLAALIAQDGALPVQRVAEIGAAMLKALQLAHAAGIIHRDLKPDNVLLMGDRVIITDFGIAHMADATTALTRTGAVIGTPAYMSPEQLEGKPPAPAGDLWSLGATLYSAVEGAPAFHGDTFSALVIAVVTKEPRPPVRAGALQPLLAALMTKDPARRPTAEQALSALDEVARTGAAVLAPIPTPTPTAVVSSAAPAPAGAWLPPQPSHAPSVGGRPPAQSLRPAGPGLHFQPTAAAGAPTGARAGSAVSPFGAVVLRFIGCMALLWAIGSVLPWNYLDTVPSEFLPTVLAITGAFSLINAVPRPRWHPAVAWLVFVLFDLALYFAVKQVVVPALFHGETETGLSEVPSEMVINLLLYGTGAWLLWWKIPGSRST
ncbi:serine/threonine protein kinase [Streptomyces sp. So13.3]|uniref:serine/threonine-protein kinase n=1 Tax=unclassified Streptomyces TaxID=2593676 RepID=UPI0011063C9E|nr:MULTISPECIES: serine/threonine-protein kinase [unclassified Streptomyces]MCZ4097929.1 serine/threonine-protein kinase [Streptomyces sp. H39-C1]QNA71677.1 serine/threonine protein kinase [Streptomyces sp. So13.3]